MCLGLDFKKSSSPSSSAYKGLPARNELVPKNILTGIINDRQVGVALQTATLQP